MTVGWFMIPAITEPMKKIFESSFGENGTESAVKGVMKSVLILQLVIKPALTFVYWLVLAGILYLLTIVLVNDHTNLYKRIFSVVAYTETIFIFMSILTVLIIYAKGLDSVEGAYDLTIFKGLDFFLTKRNSNPTLASMLSEINPFSIWYVLTISIGLSVVNKVNRMKAIGIAGMGWMIWIVVSLLQTQATKLLMNIIM